MIFNLFKSKPTLRELIPKGFVDIHSHILPGIDDGARNIEESLSLISEMKKIGFSKIIGTPHTYPGLYNNTNESIKNSFEIVQSKLQNKEMISYASEYMIDQSIIEKSEKKTLLCLKDNYVLIEMNFISEPIYLHETIYNLKLNNYIPVLAHPERYKFLFSNTDSFLKLKKYGCLFQLNLLSLTGYYGNKILKISDWLLKENLIDFVGSDAHNLMHVKGFESKVQINQIEKIECLIEKNSLFD